MNENLAVLGVLLLLGILQGLTVCNLTCGPLLFLRLAGRGKGARDGLRISFLFALPRILVLTIIGALLGGLGYTVTIMGNLSRHVWFQSAVYTIIGLIMIATGLIFTGILKRRETDGKPGLKERLMIWLMKLGPRKGKGEGRTMFGIGILVSLVCFVEASAVAMTVASLLSIEADSIGNGFIMGALSMLCYSIGLTLPLVLLGTGASAIGKSLKGGDARAVGGVLLIIIGALLILYEIIALFIM
ncbi:MAG: sulfite exporter TauE/SafE family protein, partial [Candidatus Thermoplasmatota archaeon]|nr:sulfite exporter TauE/SafE family protein [Candidatus Thermoplasmatota archaeon]